MNNFFEKLNSLSFSTILFIAASLTVASVLPLWIFIATQQTKLTTKAVTNEPVPTIAAKPTDGPVPTSPPSITRVYPWVGKPGDELVIEGQNFGTSPKNRRLAIGGVVVGNDAISSWNDTQIIALIPSNPTQGGSVSIRIDTFPVVESTPLVFYTTDTLTRLIKSGNTISVTGTNGTVNATLMTNLGTRQASGKADLIQPTPLFTLAPNETIVSLLLTDDAGTLIPYTLNPTDFGF